MDTDYSEQSKAYRAERLASLTARAAKYNLAVNTCRPSMALAGKWIAVTRGMNGFSGFGQVLGTYATLDELQAFITGYEYAYEPGMGYTPGK